MTETVFTQPIFKKVERLSCLSDVPKEPLFPTSHNQIRGNAQAFR
jgi:hypothetical protein